MNIIDGGDFRSATYALKSAVNDIESLIVRIEENSSALLTITEMRSATILRHDEIEERLLSPYKYIICRAREVECKTGGLLYEIINKVNRFEPECRKALDLNRELHSNIEFTEAKIRELHEMMYSLSDISVEDLNRWHDPRLENMLLKNLHQLGAEVSLIQNKLEKLLEAFMLLDGYIYPLSKNNLV